MVSKRVLICGGRHFNLVNEVHSTLSSIQRKYHIEEICEGGATGADDLGKLWALSQNIPVRTFDANWMLYGNQAGSIRNSKMLREFKPNFAVAFPGGAGTADMISKLIQAKVPTLIGSFLGVDEEHVVSWRMYSNG